MYCWSEHSLLIFENSIISHWICLGGLVKNQSTIYIYIYMVHFWPLYSILLILLFIPCQYYTVLLFWLYNTFWNQCESFNFVLFRDCFHYTRFFASCQFQNLQWFYWDCIQSIDKLEENWLFNNMESSNLYVWFMSPFIWVFNYRKLFYKGYFYCASQLFFAST